MRVLITGCIAASLALTVSFRVAAQSLSPVSGADADRNKIAYINRAEGQTIATLQEAKPLIEAVFQRHIPNETIEYTIEGDFYDLARFTWSNHPGVHRLVSRNGWSKYMKPPTSSNGDDPRQVLADLMVPDWERLAPGSYTYRYVKAAFLGDVQCDVFDVTPADPAGEGWAGRLYVETKYWNIVRFTGINRRVDRRLSEYLGVEGHFRVDSWRAHAKESTWLPAFSYVEQLPSFDRPKDAIVKGQVRFWGYAKERDRVQERYSEVLVPDPGTRVLGWPSPQQSRRMFEREGENNVIDRFRVARLIGKRGRAEDMLDQVITNLVVSSKLTVAAPVRSRVLLTTPFEMFSIGDTIFVSRGLLDVLPSEPSLALLVAHQLAHNVLGHPKLDSRFAFPDVLEMSDRELIERIRFTHSPAQEVEADIKALEILKQSPYGNALAEAGLFAQAIRAQVDLIPTLLQPHFGEHIADVKQKVENDDKFRFADVLNSDSATQLAALPLGSRLVINPFDESVELLRPEALFAPTPRERAEFRITPFMPLLRYADDKSGTVVRQTSSAAPKKQPPQRKRVVRAKEPTSPTGTVTTTKGAARVGKHAGLLAQLRRNRDELNSIEADWDRKHGAVVPLAERVVGVISETHPVDAQTLQTSVTTESSSSKLASRLRTTIETVLEKVAAQSTARE